MRGAATERVRGCAPEGGRGEEKDRRPHSVMSCQVMPCHVKSFYDRRAMGFGLWAMGYGLWAMGYGLWAMGYGLWAMGYGMGWIRLGAPTPHAVVALTFFKHLKARLA